MNVGFRPREADMKQMRWLQLFNVAREGQRFQFIDPTKILTELTRAQLTRLISRATKWPLAPKNKYR